MASLQDQRKVVHIFKRVHLFFGFFFDTRYLPGVDTVFMDEATGWSIVRQLG
jgi:hypothetical protein